MKMRYDYGAVAIRENVKMVSTQVGKSFLIKKWGIFYKYGFERCIKQGLKNPRGYLIHNRSGRTCDLKIDHLIAGKAIRVKDAEYIDTFDTFQNYKDRCVGIPDHKMIKATLCV